MRILEVSKLYPPFWGGIETVVYDISTVLKQEGYDVDVLCVSENNNSTEEFIDNVKVYRCASFAHLASTYLSFEFIKIWRKIRNDYDVIHVHLPNPLALLAFYLFKPRKDCKIIVHWHSDIVKQKYLKIPFIPLQKKLLACCSKIIATSHVYADASQDLKKFLNKIEVIPIGIDEERMVAAPEAFEQIKGRYAGKFVIFSLGRHVYYKGFEYLIEAARYIDESYIILLGGQGELTPELKEKITEYNLDSRVKMLGRISAQELPAYFSAADVFCLPSIERSEAFGVVQLEAMACGTPVISTDIQGSGVSWVNKHGVTGLIVPVKNAQALAISFNNLREHPINRSQVQEYFTQHYTRSKMVNCLIKVVEGA
ncbi:MULTISPECIES: glycosyltransferase [Citrobacter]|uniref:glycosyltransferase n=1 Tax=Citrobacter TaxID=544 RepID=UPI001C7DC376|nr:MULTISPECIES: glycosyltransferase [Citrobacter]MDE9678296.1 glycosyltransferase [Citrobacter portucalensis]MDM2781723.1 glycosyltransferase [Citrobacter sp. Cpo137]